MALGTRGLQWILYFVRSISNPILRSEQWIMTRWNNKQLPVINSISYDETNKQLDVLASLEGDGNWFDSVSLREFYLSDKNTGTRMSPTGVINLVSQVTTLLMIYPVSLKENTTLRSTSGTSSRTRPIKLSEKLLWITLLRQWP